VYFGSLYSVINRTLELDINQILGSVFNNESDLKELIIDLNTQGQLFDKGIDSEATLLSNIGGSYSDITIAMKRTEGLPFNRITLFDTGDFYDSFNVRYEREGFVIEANTIKEGIDLQDRWGANIIGLTDESIRELIFFLNPLIIEYTLDYMVQDL
jgi:hypothetical protein